MEPEIKFALLRDVSLFDNARAPFEAIAVFDTQRDAIIADKLLTLANGGGRYEVVECFLDEESNLQIDSTKLPLPSVLRDGQTASVWWPPTRRFK